jgi:hypothetical protein
MTIAIEGEVVQLEALEKIIERGLSSFYEVGSALMTIRNARLYKETHRTFEAYCKERWGFTRMRASQLIQAAAITGNVNQGLQPPSSERQIRPLAVLPKEQQAEAWQEAVDTAPEGKVTGNHVQEVVNRIEKMKERKKLPKFKKSEKGWIAGSQAMLHAGSAILQLERIDKMDPKRREAFRRVTDWIDSQLAEEGGGRALLERRCL